MSRFCLTQVKGQLRVSSTFSGVKLTSDVGEAKALGLTGTVGFGVKVQPNTPPGGNKGRGQHGATQPGFPISSRSQQEPVSQTSS